MNPFYFGSGQRRLFGIYSPARSPGGGPTRAVVLCPPWGNEYLAAHRSLRQLDTMLAANGWNVLRFDYFGTGDSAGDIRQADLKGWEGDIETAIEELRDTSGAPRVALAGLRLGATLAARVAARSPRDVDALALWDPFVAGTEYLEELRRAATEAALVEDVPAAARGADGGEQEVSGFPLVPDMARELCALELSALEPPLAVRTLAIVSTAGASRERLQSVLAPRVRGPLDVEAIPDTPVWIEDRNFGAAGMPVKVLQRIAEWMR